MTRYEEYEYMKCSELDLRSDHNRVNDFETFHIVFRTQLLQHDSSDPPIDLKGFLFSFVINYVAKTVPYWFQDTYSLSGQCVNVRIKGDV
jgi:hypothetical protein